MAGEPQGYYAATVPPRPLAAILRDDVKADICVIGGGFTGLSATLQAARAGAKVVLLEAEALGFGASGRNGGQIHPGYRKTQAELEAWLGKQHAHDLWFISEEGRALIFELAKTCDLKRGLVVAAHNAKAAQDLAEEAEHLAAHYGYRELTMQDAATSVSSLGTHAYQTTRLDNGGGHIHPMKLVHSLARSALDAGAVLYNLTPAKSIDGNVVRCDRGTVTADHILLATDSFTGTLAPQLAPYIAHVESFIIATERLPADTDVLRNDAAVADTRHVLDYYRKSADNCLLFAGREAYWNIPRDVVRIVRSRMLKVYPQLRDAKIEHAWAGTVGITRTRMPHFGRLAPRVLFGHGYSGHGVALSMIGGKALAEAALGNSEHLDILARVPARKFPGGPLLRKPMVSAALTTLKILDSL